MSIECNIQWEQTNPRFEENAAKISRLLKQANDSFFSSYARELDLLKNQPQTIPILAQWLYDEWHAYDVSLTKQKLIDSLNKRQNSDKIPITFIILKNSEPVGMITLKEQSDPEFSDFPRGALWMGSLYVVPEDRNKGFGKELLKFATVVAACLGHKEVFFYTSNSTNVPWYLKRGASIIEERSFRNHTVTIMKLLTKKI